MKKYLKYIAAGLALALSLSACAQTQTEVPVQRVDELTAAAAVADRFAGVVVSDNAVTIAKEADKTIEELLVKEGQQVSAGQKLFSYDSDELSLTLDKQELELDRLEAEIDDLEDQIKDLKKSIKNEKDKSTKATLELNLKQTEMSLTQAEYDEEALKTDIDYSKKMLKNVNVSSPISGTVRRINEDNYEEYIIIQQAGAYRIKGLLNEMSMNMGIMEGVAVQIVSRLNPNQVWAGVVEKVDYENAEQNSYDAMYYGMPSDGMTASSSYPFYIALDSTEGLLLGQHVYIQMAVQLPAPDMVYIPQSYLMDIQYSEQTGLTTAAVWAVGTEGTLEKRTVTLGEYDVNTGSYQVLEGLDFSDYVADPTNPDCKAGAAVSIKGKTGFEDNSGLTPSEQESIAAEIADSIENAEE